MVIENVYLIHECSPIHLRMGTIRLKYDKGTQEAGKQEKVQMERSKVDTIKMEVATA